MSEKQTAAQILDTEILSCCKTLDSVTQKQLVSVKKDQEQILQKMALIISEFEQIQGKLPKEDLQASIQNINKICERLETAKKRIQNIVQRAETMKLALDYQPPVVKTSPYYVMETYT
ncbi:hypothetical protein TVAG_028710 [Trichomonas vaginalis G3]|uniref:Biogenesis of lysosome-related organelles complex 1 subunit 7 n=1 Tax=Trichomonas vaginalis (strain ATCC PRA-98 / G3) TaxID=412133 RepID=A2E0B8_TRIV3|nr:hypothetical protein TVAGG3_0556640 [Trichomonas vaginalis G3]EAY13918.1 hypothetical protein TVAG_028710 [Trichomonas vaginalis G3]KAI5520898.1 hypothetical protein TVAGG3_0556640 [Trichomonas vaginalis G3]|eukprot:XP_001326141.1 hypothetical protein [Trichomonas vaginalis G3]